MATILPFVVRPRAFRQNPVPDCGATVIIFPGVRYEHRQGAGAVDPPRAASGGRRGRKNKTR